MSSSRISPALWVLVVVLLLGNIVCSQDSTRRAAPASPLVQAKAQFAKHDLESAETSIWKVLSSEPNNAGALLLLGMIRNEQHRFAEAETLFDRVLQLDPNSAKARVNLGNVYLAKNKLNDGLQEYQKAEQLLPQDIEVHVTLARLYVANGEFASAMSSLDAIPPAGLPPEAAPIRVACLLGLGRQEQATRIAEQVKNPAIALAMAEVFVSSKMPQEALKLLSAAAASGKRPPARFYFIKGKTLDAGGNSSAALESFQKAVALEPTSEEFLLTTAELYARQGKHEQAFAMLQRAYKLDSKSPQVLRPLILEASFSGKSAEVQDAAEQLANSDEPQDLFVAASVFIKNVRQDEAVPLLEKYVAKVPNNPSAWVGLGLGYEQLQRFDDAQEAFERALQADPKFADAEYQLGVLNSMHGDSAAAIQHFEYAVQMNPNHAPSLEKLGGLYLQTGKFEQARDVLLKSESLDPRNRQIEYGLAIVYGKLGNREEARIHMERFQKGGATEKK